MKPWRTRALVSGWADAFARGVEVGALLEQLLRLREGDQPQLAADRVGGVVGALDHGDGAVVGNRDVVVGLLEHDRSVGAEHRIAGGRTSCPCGLICSAAVAGVALAGRRLHHEERLAVDRDIQRILGLLGRSAGEVVKGGAVLDEAQAAVAADEVVFVRARHQVFLEQRAVGLETVGVDVRDVVGNDIHLPFQHHLPR